MSESLAETIKKKLSELESELKSDEEACEEALKIRFAQLKEIMEASDRLQLIGEARSGYKKDSGIDNYKSYEDNLKHLSENKRSKCISALIGVIEDIDKLQPDKVVFSTDYMEQEFTVEHDSLFNLLMSLDYTPPDNWSEIGSHLRFLTNIMGQNFPLNPQTLLNLRLDLSLCKIIKATYELYGISTTKGKREEARIKKTIKTIRGKADLKKTFVLEIYHRDNEIKSGMKLNAVANIIKETFEYRKANNIEFEGVGKIPKDMKPPSIDQIKRYLEDDGRIKDDFRKEGRYWIKQR